MPPLSSSPDRAIYHSSKTLSVVVVVILAINMLAPLGQSLKVSYESGLQLPALGLNPQASYAVTFTTSQYNGDWSNQGEICITSPIFNCMTPGTSTSLAQGDYALYASVPAVGGRRYGFDHWTTAGSVSVVGSTTSASTTIRVSGTGSVNAVYDRWDFTISVTPSSQTVKAGESAFYNFNIQAVSPVPNDGQVDVHDATCWTIGSSSCPDHTGLSGLGMGYVTLKKDTTSGTLYPYIMTDSGMTGLPKTFTIRWVGYIELTSESYWRTQDVTLTVNPKEGLKPDLTVTGIRTNPADPKAGNTVTIYATIKNNGPGELTSQIRVVAWIDSDANVYLGNFYVSPLTAGASVEGQFDTTWVMTGGSHEISVKADSLDAVMETDETNNWAYKRIGGSKPEITTDITISVTPNNLQPDTVSSITISGLLTRRDTNSGVPSRPVKLEWTGGMTTVTTDSQGRYSYSTSVGPYAVGTYPFTTLFEGYDIPTEKLLSSTSSTSVVVQWPVPTYDIIWLVSDFSVYVLESKPRLWAQVENTGGVTIGAYELQADFTVVNPSGVEIFAGTGWNSRSDLKYGDVALLENTDNSWTIPSDAKPGWYTLRVTVTHKKTSTSVVRETPNAFGVNSAPPPDFEILASPDWISITQGQSAIITVGVLSIGGYSNEVSLSSSLGPPGLSVTFTPTNRVVPTGTLTLTTITSAQTSVGTSDLVLIASDGTRTHTCLITIRVNPSSVLLTIGQMGTNKASYSPSEQVSFMFDVENVGGSSQSFRPKVAVQKIGAWSMSDYCILAPGEKRSFSYTVSYSPGWEPGANSWKVLLVGPPPGDTSTFADSGFVSIFTVSGGFAFAVKLKAQFLPDSVGTTQFLPTADVILEGTRFLVAGDSVGVTLTKPAGGYAIYAKPNVVPSGSTYFFDHWEWNRDTNTVVPASETAEATTVTITGNGELTAVFVEFKPSLSYPKDQVLTPYGQVKDITFQLSIDVHQSSKRSTVYVRIQVYGPQGAILMGHDSDPTHSGSLIGDSGIHAYTLGSQTPFSYKFGPVNVASFPGTYTVDATVYDRPTRVDWHGSVLSKMMFAPAFMVDVGISYIEVLGETNHRIIHVHYSKEDVARGADSKIKTMLYLWETAGLVLSAADLATTLAEKGRKGVNVAKDTISFLIDAAETSEGWCARSGWCDNQAKLNGGSYGSSYEGSYDYTAVQVASVGGYELGRYYECAPTGVFEDIGKEIAWAMVGTLATIALAVIFPPAGAVVLIVFALQAAHTVATYTLPIDRRWFDQKLAPPGYARGAFPAFAMKGSSWSGAGLQTDANAVFPPTTLPVKAISPAAEDTAGRITSISPGQVVQAELGAIVALTVGYQITQAYEKNQANQLMLICDFAGWPPALGSYFGIYGGIPSASGISGTQQVQIRVPNAPGSYYCWFGLTPGDDLERAANQFKGDLRTRDSHLRIDVKGYTLMLQQSGIPSGIVWGVSLNGSRSAATGSSLTVTGLAGTIEYIYDAEVPGPSGVKYVCTSGCSASVSDSATITAYFKTQYRLTITVSTSSGGSTDPPAGSYWYDSGTSVSVSATAASGYSFYYWSLDGANVGTLPSTSVVMNSAHALTAMFRSTSSISVSLAPDGSAWIISGTITPTQPSPGIPPGTPVTLSYSSDSGATWNSFITVQTSSGGDYSVYWLQPYNYADFRVRANWNGNAAYEGSTSSIETLSGTYGPFYPPVNVLVSGSGSVARGGSVTFDVLVTSPSLSVERTLYIMVVGPDGYQYIDTVRVEVSPGQTKGYQFTWEAPSTLTPGTYQIYFGLIPPYPTAISQTEITVT